MSSKLKKFFCVSGILILIGIVLTVVGAASGGITNLSKLDDKFSFVSFTEGEFKQEAYQFDDVKNINIDYVDGDVTFVEGNEFAVNVKYFDNVIEKPEVVASNGTLDIKATYKDTEIINLGPFDREDHSHPEVIVTYPAGTVFESVTIKSDDDIAVKNFKSQKTDIQGAYGDITINNAELGSTTVNVNDCDVEMINVKTTSLDMDITHSDVKINGELYGNTNLKLAGAELELDCTLPIEQYNVNISSKDGGLDVNGMDYESDMESVSQYQRSNTGAANNINVNAEYTEVDVNFAK